MWDLTASGWNAGLSTADVDAFVHRHATPVLRAAGYRRNRRKYLGDGPRGRRALIQFCPEVDAHHARFEVQYAVFTSAHDQFRSDRGFPQPPWPYATYALVHTRLFAPEWVQTGVPVPGPVFPWNWDLGTDEDHNARVGAALANGLASEVLPRIESWFDPEVMARTLEDLSRGIDRGTGTFAGLNPGPRAVAMALLDVEGADERLTQTLDLLPAGDMVRQWIERRLEQRAVTA